MNRGTDLLFPAGSLASERLVVVEAHLLQHNCGEQTVACGGPVGEACHGGVQVITLLLCPVVGVDDQLRERAFSFGFCL